jgi:hypothetical protein
MKVLYTGLARAIWSFDLNLLNPRGLSLQPVIDMLNEKYKFGKSPKHPTDVDEQQKALTFKSGLFINAKGVPISVNLNIYNDGFVADTTASTAISTEFLIEVADWMTSEFGLKIPSKVRKAFVSQLDVECGQDLLQLNRGLEKLGEFIDAHVKALDEGPRHFDCTGLSFWSEDMGKVSAPSLFKFERKISAPFSANHYFSQAPLETHHHLELLDMLETLLRR